MMPANSSYSTQASFFVVVCPRWLFNLLIHYNFETFSNQDSLFVLGFQLLIHVIIFCSCHTDRSGNMGRAKAGNKLTNSILLVACNTTLASFPGVVAPITVVAMERPVGTWEYV